MKSLIFVALFTLILMEVSILPVYLVPIWNGTSVQTLVNYPYMCGIFRNLSDGLENIPCGCSIISPNFALTAAHCFDEERAPGAPYIFFAGSVNFNEGVTREIFTNRDVTIHPDFDFNGSSPLTHFNLATIKLNPPLNFTDNIKSIGLGSPKDCKGGELSDYFITGWGSNSTYDGTYGGSYRRNLLWGNVKPSSETICEELFRLRGYDHEKNICTRKTSGACIGDYGGPLAVRITNGMALCGVTDIFCDIQHNLYTRVSYFKKWICEDTYNEPDGCLELPDNQSTKYPRIIIDVSKNS